MNEPVVPLIPPTIEQLQQIAVAKGLNHTNPNVLRLLEVSIF